ncbi:nitrogen regulation protein NR(II) [Alginatibacterium sediminis]|uniref:histidine kinase n=1 Tax=Alginatibacterium sediminis TaxID=2164068 RepID=A0A420ENQ4_9ALTE|nr:nitrogen regulation protein NR(II) [Alginatibacterium sediminis]RKF22308.1 nitrogen regulation protein NR(II) [Alginatibacterium sediminis]
MANQVSAVVLLDSELKISYLNAAAEQLIAQSAKRLSQKRFPDIMVHSSLNIEKLAQLCESGQSFTDNEVTLVFDTKSVLVELSATRLSFEEQLCILVELRPIGQQKRITQELYQHAQQQAAKELVRGLAHEIKNPLGGLRGAAQLLEKELHNEDLKEFTGVIIEQADRLRNLVDRLLGPQRPGKHEVHNVHSVLEKVRQLVRMDLPENVSIERDYDPSIPDFEMDHEQLQQAFLNIVQNAVQALGAKGGNVFIRTRTAHQVTIAGERFRLAAEIKIQDDGPGIPLELADTLFYPMVTGRDGGNGLGLSISQNLVNQHKGKIEVSSWPGHTEFTIQIPLRR